MYILSCHFELKGFSPSLGIILWFEHYETQPSTALSSLACGQFAHCPASKISRSAPEYLFPGINVASENLNPKKVLVKAFIKFITTYSLHISTSNTNASEAECFSVSERRFQLTTNQCLMLVSWLNQLTNFRDLGAIYANMFDCKQCLRYSMSSSNSSVTIFLMKGLTVNTKMRATAGD